jgi:hypothetical protein
MIEDNAGLDSGNPLDRINLKNARHVFGEVQHDRDVAALPGERSSATAAKDRSAEFSCQRNGRDHIIVIARENYTDGNLAVIRSVGSVEGAAARIKSDFAADMPTQSRS